MRAFIEGLFTKIYNFAEYKADRKGFSLPELVVTVGISSILLFGLNSIHQIQTEEQSKLRGATDLVNYQSELRTKLKSLNESAHPLCLDALGKYLSSTTITKILDAATQSISLEEIEIGQFNPLNPNSMDYGDLKINKVTMNQVLLSKKHPIFLLNRPKEITVSELKPGLFRTISAQLNVHSQPVYGAGKQVAKLRVSMVIATTSIGTELVDCGIGSLGRSTAAIDACKAFGQDFEFFLDHVKDGRAYSGQCYAPFFDSNETIGGYVPIRGFFCEPAKERKSLDFAFCTGVD